MKSEGFHDRKDSFVAGFVSPNYRQSNKVMKDVSSFRMVNLYVLALTQVIWSCLVEDSALFLRYVLERLTREKQELMFKILRHLIRFIPKLPQQAAFALYNYIIGYVMFYVRSPQEDGQKLIGTALSVLWMVSVKVKVFFFILCFIHLSGRKDVLSRV
jgi:hypothetical protein